MSEKRKPYIVLVAKIQGKKPLRVELFSARLWPDLFQRSLWTRFRVRVNKKWVNGDKTYTVTEILRQLRSRLIGRR